MAPLQSLAPGPDGQPSPSRALDGQVLPQTDRLAPGRSDDNERERAPAGRHGALGLSKAHICPRAEAEARLAVGGRYFELSLDQGEKMQVGGGLRGEIGPFTPASRRRMIYLFNRIDRTRVISPPLFGCLTYPGQGPDHWVPYAVEHKRHFKAFCQRLDRLTKYFPDAFYIWRLEAQERGAPHYHWLLFNYPHLAHALLATWWWEIVGSSDTDHLAAGTRVESLESWEQAGYYVSKYMGKSGCLSPAEDCGSRGAWKGGLVSEEYRDLYSRKELELVLSLWDHPGRWWGVRHGNRLPVAFEGFLLDSLAFYQARRILRGLARSQGYLLKSQGRSTAFINDSTGRRLMEFVGAREI